MPSNMPATDAGEKGKEREKESKLYYIHDDRVRVKEEVETIQSGC